MAKPIALVILVASPWQALAHEPADGDIHALMGPMVLRTLPLKHEFDSPYLEGVGLIVEGDLDHNGGAEISAIYMRQLYSIKRGDLIVTEKTQRMYVSTGYRHWFSSRYSLALAFYSSFAMGEAEIVQNDFGVNNSPASSAQESVTYGFDTSIQYEPLQSGRFSLVLDARYAYSITAKPQEEANVLFFMIGLKYFVQSREEGLRSQKSTPPDLR